jgi:hypothetical protein
MQRRPQIDPRWPLVALLATRAVILLVFLTCLTLREQAAARLEAPLPASPPATDSWLSEPSPPTATIVLPTWDLPSPGLVESWCRRAAQAAEAAEYDAARARRMAAALVPEVAGSPASYRLAQEAHRGAEAVAATSARALAAALIARSGYSTGLHDWSRWAAEEAELERQRAARGLWDVQQLAFEARLRLHDH